MPRLITEPACLPVPASRVMGERVGLVNTGGEAVSIADMIATANRDVPFQTPEFDEITLAVLGSVIPDREGGSTTAHAGQSIFIGAGDSVGSSSGPGDAEHVAICVPACAADLFNRED